MAIDTPISSGFGLGLTRPGRKSTQSPIKQAGDAAAKTVKAGKMKAIKSVKIKVKG